MTRCRKSFTKTSFKDRTCSGISHQFFTSSLTQFWSFSRTVTLFAVGCTLPWFSVYSVMLRVHLLHFTKCDRSRNEFWAVVVWARSGPIVYAQATTTTLAFHPTQWAESLNQPDVGGGISVASKIDWVTNTRTTWTVLKLLKVAV